ncbi:MAG: hypothetical protein JXQ73_25290 [Phycisphaerae bacterium]|nr:hypothetical protein [Phycisphaerae bacterium]
MSRSPRLVAPFMISALTTAGCGFLWPWPGTTIPLILTPADIWPNSPSYLYVVTADAGTLVADGEDANTYTLTLTGVMPDAIYFSDRPERSAGDETVQEFVDDWAASGFEDDPPNGAIVLHTGDPNGDVVIVELTGPVYDTATATLRLTAAILTDEQTGALAAYGTMADAAIPEAFTTASLFIDDAPKGAIISVSYDYPPDDAWYIPRDLEVTVNSPNTASYSIDWGEAAQLGNEPIESFTIVFDPRPGWLEPQVFIVTCAPTGQAYTIKLSDIRRGIIPEGFDMRVVYPDW